MSLLGPIIIGAITGLIGAIIITIIEHKRRSRNEYIYYDDEEEEYDDNYDDSVNYNPWNSNHSNNQKQSDYDPFDNHWESSFDWKDDDNDGYDDRDDGFWNEREF